MNRYLIQEREPSELDRTYGRTDNYFIVWDSVAGKGVPFGRHRSREGAERHIERLESR